MSAWSIVGIESPALLNQVYKSLLRQGTFSIARINKSSFVVDQELSHFLRHGIWLTYEQIE